MINRSIEQLQTGLGLDTIIIQFVLMRYTFCLLTIFQERRSENTILQSLGTCHHL